MTNLIAPQKSYYYIHGFASGKSSSTYKNIKSKIKNIKILQFDSSISYNDNIKNLSNQISEEKQPVCIIGSSLGGFFAMQLTPFVKNYVGRILINPSIFPKKSLRKYIGECTDFETGLKFNFSQKICDSYPQEIDNSYLLETIPTILLLSKNDEVLNYSNAENLFKRNAMIRFIEGGHRLSDYESLFDSIKYIDSFFNT